MKKTISIMLLVLFSIVMFVSHGFAVATVSSKEKAFVFDQFTSEFQKKIDEVGMQDGSTAFKLTNYLTGGSKASATYSNSIVKTVNKNNFFTDTFAYVEIRRGCNCLNFSVITDLEANGARRHNLIVAKHFSNDFFFLLEFETALVNNVETTVKQTYSYMLMKLTKSDKQYGLLIDMLATGQEALMNPVNGKYNMKFRIYDIATESLSMTGTLEIPATAPTSETKYALTTDTGDVGFLVYNPTAKTFTISKN